MQSFVGAYDQVPPMYSALKVNGKKLYELARKGVEVERAARRVTIHSIDILSVELPRVRMRVHCSKGTYIRTLCQDIGEKLGCGGCMESLLRTRVEMCIRDRSETQAREIEGFMEEFDENEEYEEYEYPEGYDPEAGYEDCLLYTSRCV